jgi:predicted permease
MIRLDTLEYVVVGVAAAGLHYPEGAQVWTGLGAELGGPGGVKLRQEWWARVILRLRPDVTLARARASLDRATRTAIVAGELRPALLPVVRPLPRVLEGNLRSPLVVLAAAVTTLLLIAAVNVAALLVARGIARAPELAVRSALGATRARVVRLVLMEAVVLSFGGATAGIALASWAGPALKALAGSEIPGVYRITVDLPALVAAVGIALLIGCATGLAPALLAARRSHADLRIGGHASEPPARRRTLDLLLGSQICLTVVLVAGATLLVRTLARLETVRVGFAADRVVAADLWLPSYRYPDKGSHVAFVARLLERLQHLPGVRAAGVGTGIPFGGGDLTTDVVPEGRRVTGSVTWIAAITDGYFTGLDVPLLRGTTDLHDPGAIVIDSTAARAFFPAVDPLGKSLTYEGTLGTVVGIVGDVRQQQLRELPQPHIYGAYAAYAAYAVPYLHVVARGSVPPGVLTAQIRSAIHGVDPLQPIERLGVLRERVSASFARERFVGVLLGLFAVLSLALAASGIYGALSFAVERRRREMAIRIAIGATSWDVIEALLRRSLLVVGAGVACGVVAALAGSRLLVGILYNVSRADPLSLGMVVGVVAATGLAATWFPARRATRVDPIVALRAE